MSPTLRMLAPTWTALVVLACGGTLGAHDTTEPAEDVTTDTQDIDDSRQDLNGREAVEAKEEALLDLDTGREAGSDVEPIDVPKEDACAPACAGRTCGPDGCGGNCGECEPGALCDLGACEHPCATDADCTDREACAAWPAHDKGHCVDICVAACPEGSGLQAHDGCHCRVAPIVSDTTTLDPCRDPTLGFDGYLQFLEHGFGTSLDLRSGLAWTTEPVDYGVGTDAQARCAEYQLGCHSWRLPTVDEVIGARNRPGSPLTNVGGSDHVAATMAPGDETVVHVMFEKWPAMRVATFDGGGSDVAFCVIDDDGALQGPDLATRFVTLQDGSLADSVTGLAWAALFGTSTTVGPLDAATACKLADGGWRSPTYKEIATLGHSLPQKEDCPYALWLLGLGCPYTNFPAGDIDNSYAQDGCQATQVVVRLASTGSYWLQVMPTSAEIAATILCVRPLADGDDVPSTSDNCPGVPNPGQEDYDANGLGAACDPSEFTPAVPGDPCASVPCGVADFGGWANWSCGSCPEGLVCDAGACVAVTCTSDADCQADANALPGGTVRRCNPDTLACELGFDDEAEVLDLLQRIYRGAAVYYARTDRLSAAAEPLPCQFPANQGVTPIEGTCCMMLGGPDKDNDDLCDGDAAAWDEPSWASLGVRMADPHAFVYGFVSVGTLGTARFTASAYGDQDCDTLQSTFQVQGLLPGDEPCRLAAPAGLTLAPEDPLMSALAVHLTPAQQAAFVPAPGVTSLNPYQDEASSNLAAIVDGAVAFYEAQPAGACSFPEAPPSPNSEGSWNPSCCTWHEWPESFYEYLCQPDAAAWENAAWRALGFSIPTEHAFIYETRWDDATGLLRASAYGDLDCDTIRSTFVRFARPVDGAEGPALRSPGEGGCDAEVVPGMYIENETE